MTRIGNVNLHYLKDFESHIEMEKLFGRLLAENRKLLDESNSELIRALLNQPDFEARHLNFSGNTVAIGSENELISEDDIESANETSELISRQLKLFSPWRKGPFDVFGVEIDAEWRSNLKWDRFRPYIESMKNQIVCDVGCNNGYFMFRMAELNPRLVLGIDPTRKFKLAFEYLNGFARQKNLHMELLGFEDLPLFRDLFDSIFCMGILYHHRSPFEVLTNCHGAMKKGGILFLETMGIASKEEICLIPRGRYANMPNVWFIPSEKAVGNMLHRAGFKNIECVFNERLSPDEQRKTPWAEVSSLKDFLKNDDPDLTIEGYEAPSRIYFVAEK